MNPIPSLKAKRRASAHRAGPTSPHTIVVHNHKGGVGKSTIAAHLAWEAISRGIPTLAIDSDDQGSLLLLLARSTEHEDVDLGGGSRVLWAPDGELRVARDCYRLIVIDTPPARDAAAWLRGDLLIVPVNGRLAVEGACTVLAWAAEHPDRVGAIRFVECAADDAGKVAVRNLHRAVEGLLAQQPALRGVIRFAEPAIPHTPAIKRAAERLAPAWSGARDARVKGVQTLRAWCAATLVDVGAIGARGAA